ncbi:MAG: M48 family metalloprotease [Chloroflexota bacterium]
MNTYTNPFSNTLRTAGLLATLAGILVVIGGLIGGQTGLVVGLLFAIGLNGVVYWKSDTLALKANGAREVRFGEAPRLRQIVTDLAARAEIPVPRLYIVDRPEPNAFATGRDPDHAALAVTTGILQLMDERELTAVLAHEMSHVKNRDTLIGTIAATMGGAISFVAQMAQFQMLFGGGDDDNGGNPLGALAAIILAPIAAVIVQLAVSRGREYYADASGAALTGDPEGLAMALEELDAASKRPGFLDRFRARRADGRGARAPQPALNPAFAHLYIVNPLAGVDASTLFSTHPPLRDRITRLRRMELRRAA